MNQSATLPVAPIISNLEGFSQIADLSAKMKPYRFSGINLDMRQMTWCDGNMCAPLGAVLYHAGRNLNELSLTHIPSDVESLLCKNGFLTHYGRAKRTDTYGSTIQYHRFEPEDDRVFSYFIDEQFRNKAIPEMSRALHKKFLEALMEIFSNAVLHSEKKRGPIPGGLGLKLLREFIQKNHGRLTVVSDKGYWEQHPDGNLEMTRMINPFPGTVVNIEINTSDQKTYVLSTEQVDEIPF